MHFRCPNCEHPVEILSASAGNDVASRGSHRDEITCPSCQSRFSLSSDETVDQQSVSEIRIGSFEICHRIGEGGFGTVFKAWDPSLERFVAIKIPRRDRVTQSSARAFLKEARAAAGIKHPSVVQVFEIGQYEESWYIVSEYIDSMTLAEMIRSRQLSCEEAAKILIQVCRAVEAAHAAGVIHRDLKPGNILIDDHQMAHVTDFGLARRDTLFDIVVSNDGRLLGTPAYMSPEQARGESATVSKLSDVFSLGVTLYEVVTGKKPFQASNSHTVIHKILTEEPKSPRRLRSDVDRSLETIILCAMRKDPGRRYQSAADMADDLQRYLDARPVVALPITISERILNVARTNIAVVALAMLTILFASLALYQAIMTDEADLRQLSNPAATETQTVPVRITCTIDGNTPSSGTVVDWVFVLLDPYRREPDLRYRTIMKNSIVFSGELQPGDYRVVVSAAPGGFHEVYRHVPEPDSPAFLGPGKHVSYSVEGRKFVLPPVNILRDADVQSNMQAISAGTFHMGDDRPESLRHARTVDPFLIDPTEVTVADYQKYRSISRTYPYPGGDHPIVRLSWDMATDYAEHVGKRLLTETEYEYAATNLGEDQPIGPSEHALVNNKWIYSAAGIPDLDRMRNVPVYGLRSNVAEWTDSILVPYPGGAQLSRQGADFMRIRTTRVVRGGPVVPGPNDRSLNSWEHSCRFRSAWDSHIMDDEIGFRCARSPGPRYFQDGSIADKSRSHDGADGG